MAELLATEQECKVLKARLAAVEQDLCEALQLAKQMQAWWTEHRTGTPPGPLARTLASAATR